MLHCEEESRRDDFITIHFTPVMEKEQEMHNVNLNDMTNTGQSRNCQCSNVSRLV